jgi:microcystin-dependent protein
MADIILSRVTEKSQSDGTEKLLIEYQDDIYRMPLSEIVNNSGSSESVLIDDTLTLSGYAADAAAAGDRISTVEDLISDGLAYVGDGINDATTPINADTLGGKDISYFAQKSDIKPKAGFIYPLATPNVPDGFLLCDGKAYSRTEYVELFAAIGTYYGAGDGSTTFNVPDLQTRVPVGAGDGFNIGDVGGSIAHTHALDSKGYAKISVSGSQNKLYTTFVSTPEWGYNRSVSMSVSTSEDTFNYGTPLAGETASDETMQPYTVINYIISTGKDNSVYIRDVINGAQVMPLEAQYGGTGATNADDARKNLGIREYKQNLLDNSDFRNPVNQRGQTSYNTVNKCGIDRWFQRSDSSMTVNSGYITVNSGYIKQWVASAENGKRYTFAVCDTNNVITISNQRGWDSTKECYYVQIPTGNYKWAALYEGEYTAETLPPYIPKGYSTELAECKRYYQVIPYTIARRASSYDETIYFDSMRVSPTATIYSHNNTVNKSSYYNGTGWTDADVTLSVSCFNYGCSIRVYHTDSVTDKAFGFNRIELSADL